MKVNKNRIDITVAHAKGDVLEIGCVGMGDNDVYGGENFIHEPLSKKANYLLGLDINEKEVKRLRKKGYNMICKDAQEPYDLGKQFDTIVAEENIEHIHNLKTYLENIHKHLKDDGILILTTPNAMCADFFLQTIVFGKPRVNQYHTHYHTTDTIKYILEQNGFKIEKMLLTQNINWNTTNWGGKLIKIIAPLIPQRFAREIFIIARKK